MKEKYQEIYLRELLLAMLKKWWLIILLVIFGATFTYFFTSSNTIPLYTAQSTLFIGKDPSVVASINVNDIRIGNELVNDYRELLRSRRITEKVEANLGYNVNVKNLAVYLVEESRIMYISYTDKSPELAKEITNEFTEVLMTTAEMIVGVKNISIVDYAIQPEIAINGSFKLEALIGGIIGAIIAITIIIMIILFDTRIKPDTDLEALLGLPLLGSIPKFKGEVRE